MNETLLKYFNNELHAIREHGKHFANAYPEAAKHLNIRHIDDPLVNHLIESFAFLSARVQHNIDHGSHQVMEDVLNTMYPHYLLPIPSASIIEIKPKPQNTKTITIKKGTTLSAHANTKEKKTIPYTTCYHTNVLPITIDQVHYSNQLSSFAKQYSQENIQSCLRITLKTNSKKIKLSDLDLKQIRFFIQNDNASSAMLYQQIFSKLSLVSISCSKLTNAEIPIKNSAIKPVGFDDAEAMLPFPEQSFPGYRMLSEYFAYPDKFNFFDATDLNTEINTAFDNEITISLYFTEYEAILEKRIDTPSLCLNCTPVINLIPVIAEPIRIDQQQTEYQIIVDNFNQSNELEVYHIENVEISSDSHRQQIHCEPYFGRKYHSNKNILYWQAKRIPCWKLGAFDLAGDEVFVRFSEADKNNDHQKNPVIVTPSLLCTNRISNSTLINSQELHLESKNNAQIETVQCLKPFTKTQYKNPEDNITDLIRHITHSQLTAASNDSLLTQIKSLVKIYSNGSISTEKIQQSILSACISKAIQRHPTQLKLGFCQGFKVRLEINEALFPHHGVYLFGTVLAYYLTKSCSINSFVQLQIDTEKQAGKYLWKPQLGRKTIS